MNSTKSAPHEVDLAVGANIRARRKALHMSQQTLAEAVGLTFQQVQKYERGTNRVSCSKLVEMAKALDCHAVQLLPKQDWLDDAEDRVGGESWSDQAREIFFEDEDLLGQLRRLKPVQLRGLRVFLQTMNGADVVEIRRAA